jgi:hypothetical protein
VTPTVAQDVDQEQPSPAFAGGIRFLQDRRGRVGIPDLDQQARIRAGDDFAEMIADSPAVAFLPKARLSGAAVRVILARAGGTPAAGSQRDSR